MYFEGSNAGHETDFKIINLIWVQNFRVRQRRQGIRNRSSMTNCKSSSLFQIILNSMHRFQPRIYLVVRPEGANHPITDIEQEKYRTYIFPETIFTAVTAYQNQLVSFLKWYYFTRYENHKHSQNYLYKRQKFVNDKKNFLFYSDSILKWFPLFNSKVYNYEHHLNAIVFLCLEMKCYA